MARRRDLRLRRVRQGDWACKLCRLDDALDGAARCLPVVKG